jgi:hypothetical protein
LLCHQRQRQPQEFSALLGAVVVSHRFPNPEFLKTRFIQKCVRSLILNLAVWMCDVVFVAVARLRQADAEATSKP